MGEHHVFSVGDGHACAQTDDGGIECLGGNTFFEVGDGTGEAHFTPVPATAFGAGMVKVVAGGNATCALDGDGGLHCLGRNDEGQLGDGTAINRPAPVTPIGMDSDVVDVSLNGVNTCAVKGDGSVYCWGSSLYGVLGYLPDGGAEYVFVPVLVSGFGPAAKVRVGEGCAMAILQDGELAMWGNISNSDTETLLSIPFTAASIANVKDVAIGLNNYCALLGDGSVQCSGYNDDGELGNGSYVSTMAPVPVLSLP